ncbi:hypothetical protein QRX25_02705 [Bacillus sp. L381]|nr:MULTISPECIES: hypothetical protein [Bacillus]WIX22233.1 hypothetical protein QRX25_02705 [Bacillus sp. L381]
MLTVLISNIPILILSGFVLVIVSFIAITILRVRRWNGLKQKQQSLYK